MTLRLRLGRIASPETPADALGAAVAFRDGRVGE
jgi:hypothetical protein